MFKEGDKVFILEGPHRGVIGTVVSKNKKILITQYSVRLDSNGNIYSPLSQNMLMLLSKKDYI